MKITCAITDDEPFARKGLKEYVSRVDFLELVGVFDTALGLNEFIRNNTVDVLFLDIEMPFLSGVSWLKTVENPPLVIFTTAFEQYAIEGYELEVFDYLLKPISFERFLKAVNRVQALKAQGVPETEEEYLFIKTDSRLEKVEWKEIRFLEAMQNYVKVHTDKGTHITHMPLKRLSGLLPDQQFIPVHKSFVIAKARVEAIEGNQLVIGPNKIPISKGLKKEVLAKILGDQD